jgi:hypothetical protein
MEQSSDDRLRAVSAGQYESPRLKRLRLRQMRRDARARAAQAQNTAAQAAERTGRYMPWIVTVAAFSAAITAAAVTYAIVAELARSMGQ